MKVSTKQYVRSHGRQPRGRGTWAFEFVDDKGCVLSHAAWFSGLYSEAAAKACRHARSISHMGSRYSPEVLP